MPVSRWPRLGRCGTPRGRSRYLQVPVFCCLRACRGSLLARPWDATGVDDSVAGAISSVVVALGSGDGAVPVASASVLGSRFPWECLRRARLLRNSRGLLRNGRGLIDGGSRGSGRRRLVDGGLRRCGGRRFVDDRCRVPRDGRSDDGNCRGRSLGRFVANHRYRLIRLTWGFASRPGLPGDRCLPCSPRPPVRVVRRWSTVIPKR